MKPKYIPYLLVIWTTTFIFSTINVVEKSDHTFLWITNFCLMFLSAFVIRSFTKKAYLIIKSVEKEND